MSHNEGELTRRELEKRLKDYARAAGRVSTSSSGLVFDPGAGVYRKRFWKQHDELVEWIMSATHPTEEAS